ncbi:DinB family protein [Flavobacterium sp. LB2P6]|uniref:DinB family protein n=1 Tax=unclassified Flavobacterium TaxID=196869 RepID=UPI003AAE0586
MDQTLDVNTTTRNMVSKFLTGYTLEQLNTIPVGYSNNLIWNIGHIIVTQQLLVYKLSGLPMLISEELVEKYRNGTKPESITTQAEVEEIKALLFETIYKTKADFDNKTFKNFNEYPTSTGFTLRTVEDALVFNNFHEGLHIGIMMNLKKFI